MEDRDDLQLVIYSAFGHNYDRYDPEVGAHEMFKLCNPAAYDGFIVQGNRTWPPIKRQMFVDRACALGKPVVSINYDLDGAYYVGTDNYQAMYDLVSQVLRDRGCTNTLFVNGLASSVEAQDRMRGYIDACKDQGIADPRTHQANWQIEEGIALAEQLLQHPEDLPQVAFCCNDDLAVGMQETLLAGGVRVPDDIMITGFDNREIGLRTPPRITTVDRDYAAIGQTAIRTLERVMAGEEVPKRVMSPVRLVLSGSCGYADAYDEKIMRDVYTMDNTLKHFYQVLSRFQSSVLTAESLEEILRDCEDYAPAIQCPNVYLSINDSYLRVDADKSAQTYGPISHLMAVGGERDLGERNQEHIYASYATEQLLPPGVGLDKPVYVALPLRHNKSCIGLVVTEGVSPVMRRGFLTFFLTLLSGSIESVQKKQLLEAANSRLDNLYVHDKLTGLFNRFGLDRFGGIAYDHMLRDFGQAYLTFLDIDGMKGINDRYGHEAGDSAILDTADIVRRATAGENAFVMRYGGDEFLVISRNDLIPRFEQELALLKETALRPYDLGLSMGVFVSRRESCLSLAEAITCADVRMYAAKRANKTK
ncbi:MAG: GGDEF domain-containing protein [Coriobacteriales bacterium]|nr:GGDEF domain-containing protein [Coriobacteriales bacterium]